MFVKIHDFFSERMTETEKGFIRLDIGDYDSDSVIYGIKCQVKEEDKKFSVDITLFYYPSLAEAFIFETYTFQTSNDVTNYKKDAKECAKGIIKKISN